MRLKLDLSNLAIHIPLDFPYLTTLILQRCSIHNITFNGESIFQNVTALRYLDLSYNQITNIAGKAFKGLKNLKTLILNNNLLTEIEPLAFGEMTQSLSLDLSFNGIKEITDMAFTDLDSLVTLSLSHNPLVYIDGLAFKTQQHLTDLQLSNTKIGRLENGIFSELSLLKELNLSTNKIKNVELGTFANLKSLQILDIQSNSIELKENMFRGLDSLQYLYADSYKLCCIRPKSVSSTNCFAPNELISSCSTLIALDALRVILWMIGVSAVIGNFLVIIYRFTCDKDQVKKSHSIFIINLSISDFIMGFYMLVIAVVDIHYSGRYASFDDYWRKSTMCTVAGILSTISSEMSAFLIFMITVDRFIVVVFPFSRRKITWRSAIGISTICWIVAIMIAVTPQVFFQSYFKGEFYTRSSVCLALPLTREHSSGEEFAVGVFIGLNSLLFLFIVIAQICIYKRCKRSSAILSTQNRKRELAVARSLILVVATDFLCWFPIGVIGIWSQTGGSVPSDVYPWVMVFVLPVNSAINPFLYTYTYVKRKRKAKVMQTVWKHHADTEYDSSKRSTYGDICQTNTFKAGFFSKSFKMRPNDKSLESHLEQYTLSPGQIFLIAKGTIHSLAFLHEREIIHGNVCQKNISIRLKNQEITGSSLILEEKPVKEDAATYKDIEQFGLLVRKLLKRMKKH